jgi:hypothetical protein
MESMALAEPRAGSPAGSSVAEPVLAAFRLPRATGVPSGKMHPRPALMPTGSAGADGWPVRSPQQTLQLPPELADPG